MKKRMKRLAAVGLVTVMTGTMLRQRHNQRRKSKDSFRNMGRCICTG